MKALLKKQSRYKKYEQIALIDTNYDAEDTYFVVAFHYNESDTGFSYGNTPAENVFKYTDEKSKLIALKQAIKLYESIRV